MESMSHAVIPATRKKSNALLPNGKQFKIRQNKKLVKKARYLKKAEKQLKMNQKLK